MSDFNGDLGRSGRHTGLRTLFVRPYEIGRIDLAKWLAGDTEGLLTKEDLVELVMPCLARCDKLVSSAVHSYRGGWRNWYSVAGDLLNAQGLYNRLTLGLRNLEVRDPELSAVVDGYRGMDFVTPSLATGGHFGVDGCLVDNDSDYISRYQQMKPQLDLAAEVVLDARERSRLLANALS